MIGLGQEAAAGVASAAVERGIDPAAAAGLAENLHRKGEEMKLGWQNAATQIGGWWRDRTEAAQEKIEAIKQAAWPAGSLASPSRLCPPPPPPSLAVSRWSRFSLRPSPAARALCVPDGPLKQAAGPALRETSEEVGHTLQQMREEVALKAEGVLHRVAPPPARPGDPPPPPRTPPSRPLCVAWAPTSAPGAEAGGVGAAAAARAAAARAEGASRAAASLFSASGGALASAAPLGVVAEARISSLGWGDAGLARRARCARAKGSPTRPRRAE